MNGYPTTFAKHKYDHDPLAIPRNNTSEPAWKDAPDAPGLWAFRGKHWPATVHTDVMFIRAASLGTFTVKGWRYYQIILPPDTGSGQ